MLLGAPFNLSTDVYAKVIASNVVGDSQSSEVGGGAYISMSYPPDAPNNLLRDEESTSRSIIAFSWTDGASNGGQPILDYRISFDQAKGVWVEL